MRKILSVLVATVLLMISPGQAHGQYDLFGGSLKGKKLRKAIQAANSQPLGTEANPVRAFMPQGQHDYLLRLRCEDNSQPKFERRGSVGRGPFGRIMDVYAVDCDPAAPRSVDIYMDMYHAGYVEKRPVPGFAILPN